jgi:hypothetical protein
MIGAPRRPRNRQHVPAIGANLRRRVAKRLFAQNGGQQRIIPGLQDQQGRAMPPAAV